MPISAYFALSRMVLCRCRRKGGKWELTEVASDFGPFDRDFVVLPQSECVVGIAASGMLSPYDPDSHSVRRIQALPSLLAGPAVDPVEDAWYYAHEEVVQYVLTTEV